MKVAYDPEVDSLMILFSEVPAEESNEVNSGVILDYSKDGKMVALEILDASKTIALSSIQFEVVQRKKNSFSAVAEVNE
jgi:uncharacterized protein YuzE